MKPMIMNKTLEYYNRNAQEYVNSTLNADMSESCDRFLKYVKEKGTVLDLGCGSGRDSLYFKGKGYAVTAADGAEEMCRIASIVLQQEVLCIRFEELEFDNQFDGVWACASLLHAKKSDMKDIFNRIHKSLKDEGIFFFCFKYGETEREKDGRDFSDYTENDLPELIGDNFTLLEHWISGDVREGRNSELWINAVVKKL